MNQLEQSKLVLDLALGLIVACLLVFLAFVGAKDLGPQSLRECRSMLPVGRLSVLLSDTNSFRHRFLRRVQEISKIWRFLLPQQPWLEQKQDLDFRAPCPVVSIKRNSANRLRLRRNASTCPFLASSPLITMRGVGGGVRLLHLGKER